MPYSENLADLGYLALVVEATKGTVPSTPGVSVPLYSETMALMQNNMTDDPIVGQKFASYQLLPGMRSYGGTVEIMAEPNTTEHVMNMLLTAGAITGSNPYTHPYTLSATPPKSYTVDIAKGDQVFRYWGVECSDWKPTVSGNEWRHQLKLSALGQFGERTIASVATVTLTLDTNFTSTPSKGLVVGDLVQVSKADGSTILQTTVASITDGVTVVLAASAAAFAAGDRLTIRPATAGTYTLQQPFLFTNTQFCLGATASAALSAAQVNMEEGSAWHIQHKFNKDQGEHRSGTQEPLSLVRTLADADVTLKRFFDALDDLEKYQNLTGQALVIRCYAGAANIYEMRITFNDLRIQSGVEPGLKNGEVLMSNLKLQPVYKVADGQAFDVKVINSLAA